MRCTGAWRGPRMRWPVLSRQGNGVQTGIAGPAWVSARNHGLIFLHTHHAASSLRCRTVIRQQRAACSSHSAVSGHRSFRQVSPDEVSRGITRKQRDPDQRSLATWSARMLNP